ncbi:MAG: PIG-L family deacetylase [Gammaproteobacteria bacterium]|nr:PIG-L family deacetylase [Gammaproteobacteria bacterium]
MIDEGQIIPFTTSPLPVESGPWLVFAPHADDESFGMGGSIAKATDQGIKVELVIMTDGALGGSQENLVDIRRNEACAAAALLGLEPPVFLNKKDRELSLDDATLAQVVQEIERVSPAAVFFPGVFEIHPDHRMTALLVWKALGKLTDRVVIPVSYEVLVQSPVNTLVDISAYSERKKAAMQVYKSQLDENRYVGIALALNKLRTLTLHTDVAFAEGFCCFEPEDINGALEPILIKKISSLLRLEMRN